MSKNGSVKIGNTEMYYASFGNGPKCLVVLPGLGDGLATVKGKAWFLAPLYKPFFKDYTVYVFSRKNAMPEGYSIEDMADDQVLALKTLGIDKVSVLGVSQGGMIAQYIAIKYPEIMDKLILAVTAPNANETVRKNVSDWIDLALQGNHNTLMADTAEKMYSENYLKKYRKYLPLLAKFTKPSTYDRFLINANAIFDFDATSELSKIQCPTLIIAGAEDKTVGQDAAVQLNNGIPNSELYTYPGLGHGAFDEAKDFYKRVYDFCER